MVVGTVVIGLSTSAPELVTSIEAALLNLPGLALGSVIRSNIANLTLILGLAAVIRHYRLNHAKPVATSLGC